MTPVKSEQEELKDLAMLMSIRVRSKMTRLEELEAYEAAGTLKVSEAVELFARRHPRVTAALLIATVLVGVL